jgi:hypothetical protein
MFKTFLVNKIKDMRAPHLQLFDADLLACLLQMDTSSFASPGL